MSGLYVKAVTFAYRFSIFYYICSISGNLYGPILTLVMIQDTICPLNTFCSWNLKTLFFIWALNVIILWILEWYLENLALSHVMNTHAACFNCSSYELVWNGNKHGVAELRNPWVVQWLSDLWQLQIYWCNSISKYRFIDILLCIWGTCHPSTIDRGEHPTINISLGHFKILRASWEPCAIMYSESITLVVDYLCGDLRSQKQGVSMRSCYYIQTNKNLTFLNLVIHF